MERFSESKGEGMMVDLEGNFSEEWSLNEKYSHLFQPSSLGSPSRMNDGSVVDEGRCG
jgi:hypothetical protein